MKCRILFICLGVALCGLLASQNSVNAQGTAFTYQGRLLSNAAPVTGSFDLQFILRPQSGGSTQVGNTLTNSAVGVTNGVFSTVLDFGNVFAASPLYLEIGVRPTGTNAAFTVLSPDQLITSAPYAVQALNSAGFTGALNDSQLSANIPRLNGTSIFTGAVTLDNSSGVFGGTLSGTFNGAATGTFSGDSTGTFTGDGGAITNLNVTNLIGVVQSNPNWQIVQAPTQQVVVANNYLITNASRTTLVLPANPAVGGTTRLAGSGANGWVVSQTAGQSVITVNIGLPAGQAFAANSLPAQSWHALAASANGLKMAAAYGTGFIYYSNDGGQTWTKSDAPSLNWTGIASSADGSHMVAVPNGGTGSGFIYTSSNGGTNWVGRTQGLINTSYRCVASSADGINLVAAVSGIGGIYTSANGGTNWTQRTVTAQNWMGVASSADGTRLAAAPNGARIYISKDSGATWNTNGPSATWSCITSSADGNRLAAAVSSVSTGFIYTSGDGGTTWTPRATNATWTSITSSADGMNLAAAYSLGYIFTSNDSGQTWMPRTNGVSTALGWSAIASSGDGTRLVAGVGNGTGLLYTSAASTTVGTNGFLLGTQYSSIELQYIGNGQWMPLSFTGSFTAR